MLMMLSAISLPVLDCTSNKTQSIGWQPEDNIVLKLYFAFLMTNYQDMMPTCAYIYHIWGCCIRYLYANTLITNLYFFVLEDPESPKEHFSLVKDPGGLKLYLYELFAQLAVMSKARAHSLSLTISKYSDICMFEGKECNAVVLLLIKI